MTSHSIGQLCMKLNRVADSLSRCKLQMSNLIVVEVELALHLNVPAITFKSFRFYRLAMERRAARKGGAR
jgi:hypothetical protein